ncbi:MAG: hypothetical protein QGI73_04370 [Candidatus Thalassarchaeaceae archaeon]|jgi:hypothetical protein|nr:hypothetical protein [Candidatus Thalassarchaeaceae archaeon]
MRSTRVTLGWLSSIALVSLSLISFLSEGYATTETWGFLLLTPLTLALALAPVNTEGSDAEGSPDGYWDEEDSSEGTGVELDEVGFDSPIL